MVKYTNDSEIYVRSQIELHNISGKLVQWKKVLIISEKETMLKGLTCRKCVKRNNATSEFTT